MDWEACSLRFLQNSFSADYHLILSHNINIESVLLIDKLDLKY